MIRSWRWAAAGEVLLFRALDLDLQCVCVCRTSSGLVSGLRSCNHKCFDSSALINSEGSDSLPRLGRLDSNHHLKAGPPTVERVLGCAIRYMSYMYVMLTRNNCKVWLKVSFLMLMVRCQIMSEYTRKVYT